ncbi:hypothetical protein SteCoe_10091 [Stentor coeruleus]|uniref:Uncharacterized protein n=1 Tax=Stentor coeruleus TaxID=5963 RepID=A0A1R2CG96_9CILI|nr:hypothetical protein SteCoe_10091 [Stentor coeruleus]
MLDASEDQHQSHANDIKGAVGHCLLLTDMCFFVSATLNAHLHYMESWETECSNHKDRFSVKAWTTVGYILRIIFTIMFMIRKISNLYKFIARKHTFPKVGAFYSPLMSTLLISVIVYDFQKCEELSDIFTLNSARRLLSWYSMIILVVLAGLLILFIIALAKKKNHRSKAYKVLLFIFGLVITIGSLIGIIANLEMVKKNKITLFSSFDLYSFGVSFIALLTTLISRFKKHDSPNVSAISSL